MAHSIKEVIVLTNNEAADSKMSCILARYYEDPFVKYFQHGPARRQPLINRGYFYRVCAVDSFIQHFLANGGKQVVILGAGFDTSYFRLKTLKLIPNDCKWFEVDYETVVETKKSIIARYSELSSISDQNYSITKCDLNDVRSLDEALDELDPKLPTLYLSEVVLVYINAMNGDRVIDWCIRKTPNAVFGTYEMYNPDDSFGKMMIMNLNHQGCALLSLEHYPTLDAQEQRYLRRGFKTAHALSMCAVERLINREGEASRLMRIEPLDEFEEWNMIQDHYCFVIASSEEQKDIWAGFEFKPQLPRPSAK